MKTKVLLIVSTFIVLLVIGFAFKNDLMCMIGSIKLNVTDKNIVEIPNTNSEVYITKMQKGTGYNEIKKLMERKGWSFKNQEGAAFFFQKDSNTIEVTTEMWTKKFIIATIQR